MSIKGNMFRFLSQHLKEKLTFDQSLPGALPSVQWIDKYNSQTLKPVLDPSISYPAIFIGFSTFKWSPSTYKVQKGTGVIRVHTVFENTGDSHLGSATQNQALAFFEFNEAVFKALEGVSATGFSPLSRVMEKEDFDHDHYIVTIADYQTQLLDDSADEAKNHQLTDPELTVTANNFIVKG